MRIDDATESTTIRDLGGHISGRVIVQHAGYDRIMYVRGTTGMLCHSRLLREFFAQIFEIQNSANSTEE